MQSSRRKKRRISPREHIRNYRRDRSMYRRMHWYADFPTIVLTAILAIFGVVMIFSASYYKSLNTDGSPFVYLRKQTIFVVGGFILMYLFSYVDYRKWKKFIQTKHITLLMPTGTSRRLFQNIHLTIANWQSGIVNVKLKLMAIRLVMK